MLDGIPGDELRWICILLSLRVVESKSRGYHSESGRLRRRRSVEDGGKLRDLGNFSAAIDWCAWKNVPSSFHPPVSNSGPCEKGDNLEQHTSFIRQGSTASAFRGNRLRQR